MRDVRKSINASGASGKCLHIRLFYKYSKVEDNINKLELCIVSHLQSRGLYLYIRALPCALPCVYTHVHTARYSNKKLETFVVVVVYPPTNQKKERKL